VGGFSWSRKNSGWFWLVPPFSNLCHLEGFDDHIFIIITFINFVIIVINALHLLCTFGYVDTNIFLKNNLFEKQFGYCG